jgi:hypothetical protein
MTITHSFLIEQLTFLGLVINGKPLFYTGFKDRIDSHRYGRGTSKKYIHYVGHPKQNLFGFYTPFTEKTKEDELKVCYKMYVDLVAGSMEDFKDDYIQWGNCGIPLGYAYLRRNYPNTNETNDLTKDLFGS